MDGFTQVIRDLLIENGCPEACIFHRRRTVELPGYFRATKQWDLIVVCESQLLAAIELKSHIGPSFGNNLNNRTEEALGNALDLWTAFREGKFQKLPRPWLGFFLLLEEAPGSLAAVKSEEPHFPVFPEFKDASYKERYEILCSRLVQERLYDGCSLVLASRAGGKRGKYSEPNDQLSFARFGRSLTSYLRNNL